MSYTCQPYQPLPISTGAVGIDRCGNIEVYAAPSVVKARVDWPPCGWPVPAQLPWWPWCGGSFPGPVGSGPPWPWWGGGGWPPMPMPALEQLMVQGAPMAQWMLGMRQGAQARR